MSTPFKAPRKVEVKVPDDKKTTAAKYLQESIKNTINLFLKETIDVVACVDMLEEGLHHFCKMAERTADLEMIERMNDLMDSEEETEFGEEGNPDFIDSVHSQPRWED